jgi:putative membrane protein
MGRKLSGKEPGMFIDNLSLLLLNMAVGYVLLAAYVYRGLDEPLATKWVPGFAMVGAVAFLFGSFMIMTWPLPGPYNSAFGEMSVLLGVIFLGAALAIAKNWSLVTVATYAFFAGIAAIVLGARIINLGMTAQPAFSGFGFILSGFAGIMAVPTLLWFRHNRPFRTLAAMILLAAALIWAVTVYPEYWMHMKAFAKWVPLAMRSMPTH